MEPSYQCPLTPACDRCPWMGSTRRMEDLDKVSGAAISSANAAHAGVTVTAHMWASMVRMWLWASTRTYFRISFKTDLPSLSLSSVSNPFPSPSSLIRHCCRKGLLTASSYLYLQAGRDAVARPTSATAATLLADVCGGLGTGHML
jgi:hypothetical protein